MAKFLITGGAGFIGGNFLNLMVNKYPGDEYICLDKLTYAGNLETIEGIKSKGNFKFVREDICNRETVFKLFEKERFDYVINFAAESHVDKSINEPDCFVKTNILGTQVLLDASKEYKIKRFHQISTDEVYGDLPLDKVDSFFTEEASLRPSNPYSASKASADLLVLAYHRTFNLPISVSRCSNNYGPYQFPEKLIPLMIQKAFKNERLPIYGNGKNVRDWIYVSDHCEAIDMIVRQGKDGEIYNICGHSERNNLDVVKTILKILNKPETLITYVKDRPGHDLRYGLDSAKIENELHWKAKCDFEFGIRETVKWFANNKKWTDEVTKRSLISKK